MSGLLDFALGFGQGAAGAVVQDRQMALQEQRQANLERLRAQFAREQQTAEIDEAQSLITSARGGDEAAQNRLRAMGKDWRDPAGPRPSAAVQTAQYLAQSQGLQPGTPEYSELMRNQLDRSVGQKEPERIRIANSIADAMGIEIGSAAYGRLLQDMVMRPQTQVSIDQRAETEFSVQMARGDAQLVQSAEERAVRAMDQMSEIDRIEAALDSGRFQTGAGAGLRQSLGQIAVLVGLDPEEIPLIGSPVTADTIDASSELIAANLLGDVASNSAMRGSVALLNMVRNAGPQLSRTPEGNRIIVEVLRGKAEREVEVAQMAQEYIRMGSLRPDGMPSFFEAVATLNRERPIVSPELRERIMYARDNAPSSQEIANTQALQLPTVSVVIGPTSRMTPQQVEQVLDQAGIAPGDRFIDALGRVKQRPIR